MVFPRISYWNCGAGLIGKLPIIFEHINTNKVDIFFVAEAEIKPDIDLNALKLKGYSFLLSNTINRGKSRLACWLKDGIGVRLPQFEGINNDVIVLKSSKYCIVGFYRPFKCYAGENQRTNFERLLLNLETCASNFQEICITGDININFNSTQVCPFRSLFENFLDEHNLDQLVMSNTRSRMVMNVMQSSLLDIVVTNIPFLVVEDTHQHCSDHVILDIASSQHHVHENRRTQVTFNDWRWYAPQTINALFNTAFGGMNIFNTCPEMLNNQLVTAICNCLNILVPKRVVTLPNKNSVTNPTIQNLKNRKSRLFKLYKRTHSDADFQNLKQVSKKLNYEIRQERKRKFQFHAQQSARAFWNSVNHLIGKQIDSSVCLTVNNNTITDDLVIAENFSCFFKNKVDALIETSQPLHETLRDLPRNESENDFFTEEEIINALKNLKPTKAQGFDEVPSVVLKHLSISIVRPLTRLFNIIIETGIIPKGGKISRIVPVFKSGDKTSVSNYRPVSNISSLSKVFEKALIRKLQNNYDLDLLFGTH